MVMLPYFKMLEEVRRFISCVGGRAKTMLLLETAEAEALLENILEIEGIDEYHIGLNDLGLEKKKRFLFELLSDGTVEKMCRIMAKHGKIYGFGGIASPGKGLVPAEYILREHYRYGSSLVILSRSFCNANLITDPEEVREIFQSGIRGIRALEKECGHFSQEDYRDNHEELKRRVQMVVDTIDSAKN